MNMLRSFEQVRHPPNTELLIAANNEHAALVGGGSTYAMPWHWHDCLMFILPSHGSVELKHEDQREGTWLSQDRFAVVPPDRAHSTCAGIGIHNHVALYVTCDALLRIDAKIGSLSEFYRRTRSTVQLRRTSAMRAIQALSVRRDLGAYGGSQVKHDLSSALVVQCIAEVIANDPVPSSSNREHGMALVADIKAFLTLNLDQEFPLDALGQRFGISRRHVTRLFREGTGYSIGEFQQQARIQSARSLLEETDLPISEIAYRVGFDSGAALAHAMRRAVGRSPSDVRAGLARSIKN
jgi:AraC family transcriptional regulator